MMFLIGFTFCVDESFTKREELISTNGSQNFLNNRLGNDAKELNSSLIFVSQDTQQTSNTARVKRLTKSEQTP